VRHPAVKPRATAMITITRKCKVVNGEAAASVAAPAGGVHWLFGRHQAKAFHSIWCLTGQK